MIVDVGDAVPLRHKVYDDGVLTNATVTLTVTSPSGVVTTPTVTNPSTGIYEASFTATAAGLWLYVWSVSGTVIDSVPGAITALDPAPPVYFDLDPFKVALGETNTDRDLLLLGALRAASRGIDNVTGRFFYATRTASARTLRTRNRTVPDPDGEGLIVPDIASTTGMVVEVGDSVTWTAVTDYTTEPDDAATRLRPIVMLRRNLGGTWSSYSHVRITTRWGYPAVPDEVVLGCQIQSTRLYSRKNSPEGIAGNAEWGVMRVARIDPDVKALISDHILMVP